MCRVNIKLLFYFVIAQLAFASQSQEDLDSGKCDALTGKLAVVQVAPGQSLEELGRQYDIGFDELLHANPNLDIDNLTDGDTLLLPKSHLILANPQQGIVVNLPERRLYYFLDKGRNVISYPVGIGEIGWATPLGEMTIIGKRKNPHWYVPKSVWEKHQKDGITLPKIVAPGPDNPLGPRAMRLSSPTYLIHGTNDPDGIGKRSTAGCISMYPEDVVSLYKKTPIKTPVKIVNEDLKWYVNNNKLCVEVHHPLISENSYVSNDEQQQKFAMLELDYNISQKDKVYWGKILEDQLGIPQCVNLETEKKNASPDKNIK